MLILPPSLAHDIRNIDELSHAEFMKEACDFLLPPKFGELIRI
jgi:hypothetical protein